MRHYFQAGIGKTHLTPESTNIKYNTSSMEFYLVDADCQLLLFTRLLLISPLIMEPQTLYISEVNLTELLNN